MVKKAFLLGMAFFVAIAVSAFAANEKTAETPVLTKQQLQADFAILKRAYTELHPGLYRYADKATVGRYFDDLEQRLQKDMTVPEAYLEFSRFLGKIRCGHTYANFWNQSDGVQRQIFGRADKVPFTFRLIDRRMIVIENASADERLQRGTEILAINNTSVQEILTRLLPLVKGDGSNDAKRLHDLQLTGDGEFEAFDVYFPLLYPPVDGAFRLDFNNHILTVPAVTRSQRAELIEKRSGKKPVSNDDLWKFEVQDGETAYLKLGTFATWEMKLDWKAFLKNAFEEISRKKVKYLILDIRGNEGGADEVNDELLTYLLSKPVKIEGRKQLLRYRKIPADLNPYLNSWDDSFRDFGDKVKDLGDGFYTWTDAKTGAVDLPASERAFRGKFYLLVDAANSSATFHLASLLKKGCLATLVGEPTGGNRRGTTGGRIAFMKLPNSGIEMDIPLVGTFPLTEQPDEGIMPSVLVRPSVEDVTKGVDTPLEAVRRLIAGK